MTNKAVRPEYDGRLIRRVSAVAELVSVELVGSFFVKSDDSPLPSGTPLMDGPSQKNECIWDCDEERSTLGAVLRFEAAFEGSEPPYGGPYYLGADFRAIYRLTSSADLGVEELENFAYWNGLLHVWPYWREYYDSVLQRSAIPHAPVPLFRFPAGRPHAEEQLSKTTESKPASVTKKASGSKGAPARTPAKKKQA